MSSYLCICYNQFFKILHKGTGQVLRQNYVNGFSEKTLLLNIQGFFVIFNNEKGQQVHEKYINVFLDFGSVKKMQ